jgi:hypothetical protein
MKKLLNLFIFSLVILGFTASPSLAKNKGVAPGYGKDVKATGSVEKAGKRITDEAIEAVTDELVGKSSTTTTTATKVPPGLAKKGKTPPGLAKKGKTPPGWQKTEKTTEKKEGLIRRFIGGLFNKG